MNKLFSNKIAIAVLTLPALLLFTVVIIYPTLQSVIRSFTDWDGINTSNYVGFQNYFRLFRDDIFYVSIKNGLIFTGMITVYQLTLGTLFAVVLSKAQLKGRKFFRISFFIPVVISSTIICQLWVNIYDGQNGLINHIFNGLGINYQQDWLGQENTAIFALAFVNAWQYMGYHMVLIYAGLKNIPAHFHEAAVIDGANAKQTFFRVTAPLLSEVYKICAIMSITGGLRAFDQMFIMTRGGPGVSSFTMTMLLQRVAFGNSEFGFGSAVAVILVLQCVLAMLVINRFIARERITY